MSGFLSGAGEIFFRQRCFNPLPRKIVLYAYEHDIYLIFLSVTIANVISDNKWNNLKTVPQTTKPVFENRTAETKFFDFMNLDFSSVRFSEN